jgi:hypothetical protein
MCQFFGIWQKAAKGRSIPTEYRQNYSAGAVFHTAGAALLAS